MANQFQSIFDDNVEAEKQFDCMFGADEDDRLIEAVLTINEDAAQADLALPDDAELHQTDDNAKPKDLRDELGPDHDANKPTADSSDQEIISKDDDDILDLACPKFGVQDAVQKNDPDNTDITDEIEKSEKNLTESLLSLLDEADTDLGDNEGLGEPGDLGEVDDMGQASDQDELEDNEDKNENEEMKEPVNTDESSLVEALLSEESDPEQSVDAEYTDPEDDMGEPDINNNAKAGAEGTDDDPVYEDAEDLLNSASGNGSKDPEQSVGAEYTDPEDDMGEPDINNNAKAGAEGTDDDPVYEDAVAALFREVEGGTAEKVDAGDPPESGADETMDDDVESAEEAALIEALLNEIEGEAENDQATTSEEGGDPEDSVGAEYTRPENPDVDVEEAALVEALLREAEDLPEEVEDELIDDAENAGEMSDADVDDIDDVYDDDLLDDLMGES